jgi:hypothetical protein
MDPVTLVESALATGALSGLKDTASQAVKDAYAALKAKVKDRFTGNQKAELVLAEHAAAPQTWGPPLVAELTTIDVDQDLVAAAQALMTLVDPVGSQRGKYDVDNSAILGSHLGDHNIHHNTEINVFRMSDQARIDGGTWDIHIGQPGA